jgi:hypothetical protein
MKSQQNQGFENAKSTFVQFDGGLNLNDDPIVIQPPQTTTATNVWYSTPGQVRSLPPFIQGQFSNFNFTNTYAVFPRDVQEPFTTGDVLALAEVPDVDWRQNTTLPATLTAPFLVTGSAKGASRQHSTSPLYPINIRQKLTFTPDLAAPASTVSPLLVMASNAAWGILTTATVTGGVVTASLNIVDASANTVNEIPLTLTFNATITQIDMTEFAGNPGVFLLAYVSTSGAVATLNFARINKTAAGALTSTAIGTITLVNTTSPIVGIPVTPSWQLISAAATTYVVANGATGASNVIIRPVTTTGLGTSVTLASGQVNPGTAIGAWVDDTGVFVFVAYNGVSNNSDARLIVFNSSNSGIGAPVSLPFSSNSSIMHLTGYAKNGICTVWGTGSRPTNTNTSPFPNPAWTINLRSVIFTYSGATLTAGSSNANSGQMYLYQATGLSLASRAATLLPGSTSGVVLVRTGSVDPVTTSATQYAQPTYVFVDQLCRVVGALPAGQAPADTSLYTPVGATFGVDQQMLPPVPKLSNPNAASMLEAIFPVWQPVVEGFNAGPYTAAQLNNGGAFTVGGFGPPNIVQYRVQLISATLAANLSTSSAVTAGRSQVFSGLLPLLFDGRSVSEAGWLNAPHWPVAGTSTGTITLPAGTYLYRAIYRWFDAAGQIHRSSPSPALSVTVPVGGVNVQNILVPNPPFTARLSNAGGTVPGSGLGIELYRTDAGGTTFYLVGSANAVQAQSQIAGSNFSLNSFYTNFADSTPPTTSSAFGVAFPAYWQSHYQSSQLPNFVWQCSSQGRHFALACVDGSYRVYFSNVWSPGIAPEWSVTGYVQVPPELGDCRSMAPLDDKILIFATRGVGVFNGQGPGTAPGSNGIDLDVGVGFSLVVPIPNSSGVQGSGCPVTLPTGVMYQAAEGFSMIGRGLEVDHEVGAPVEVLTGYYGTAGTQFATGNVLPEMTAVVFTNPSGDALVFDYQSKKWSTWRATDTGPIAGIVQRQDGTIYAAQQLVSGATLPTNYTAKGVSVNNGVSVLYQPGVSLPTQTNFTLPNMVVETPWLNVGEVPGGEGAAWEALLLGQYFSPHILQVEIATNFGDYGNVANYITQFPVSTDPKPYQFRIRTPNGARVFSIRYRITLLPPAVAPVSVISDYARITGLMVFSGSMQGNSRLGYGVSR